MKPSLFSADPEVRRVEQNFVTRLVWLGARRFTNARSADAEDEAAESVMALLDSGALDMQAEDAAAAVPFAQPVAFDDLKEVDVEDWARRRGIEIKRRR